MIFRQTQFKKQKFKKQKTGSDTDYDTQILETLYTL